MTFNPQGVIPVLEVPFDGDEVVDYDGFVATVHATAAAGADSVMFPAFASEFIKLAPDERSTLESLAVERGAEAGLPVILAVQEHATRLASRAVERAVGLGAAGINVLPPHRIKISGAQMRRHLSELLRAADGLPVVVQYAPAETGASLDLGLVAELCAGFPNLWGVKVDSNPAGPVVEALRALTEEVGRPVGAAVGYAGLHLVDCVRRGATAVQPGCSFTELYVELWRLLGDPATFTLGEDLHRRMLPYLSHWMQSVELVVAVEKEISRRRGWFPSATVRSPGADLDRLEHERIERFLAEFQAELTASH